MYALTSAMKNIRMPPSATVMPGHVSALRNRQIRRGVRRLRPRQRRGRSFRPPPPAGLDDISISSVAVMVGMEIFTSLG